MKDEATTEAMIQKAGLAGRRLAPADIDRVIMGEQFAVLGLTTICLLTLANGFTVTGESACVSPENFNAEIGEKVARENARAKIWALEGYRLKEACFRNRPLESYEPGGQAERVLDAPAAHDLAECLAELKYGRPAKDQDFLQDCIATLQGDQTESPI